LAGFSKSLFIKMSWSTNGQHLRRLVSHFHEKPLVTFWCYTISERLTINMYLREKGTNPYISKVKLQMKENFGICMFGQNSVLLHCFLFELSENALNK
jgi:hypothetical protein